MSGKMLSVGISKSVPVFRDFRGVWNLDFNFAAKHTGGRAEKVERTAKKTFSPDIAPGGDILP